MLTLLTRLAGVEENPGPPKRLPGALAKCGFSLEGEAPEGDAPRDDPREAPPTPLRPGMLIGLDPGAGRLLGTLRGAAEGETSAETGPVSRGAPRLSTPPPRARARGGTHLKALVGLVPRVPTAGGWRAGGRGGACQRLGSRIPVGGF